MNLRIARQAERVLLEPVPEPQPMLAGRCGCCVGSVANVRLPAVGPF